MRDLTQRQEEVLDFIKSFLIENKFPPTIREIATNFDVSVKGAYDHVKALEKKRFLSCGQGRSRAIEVLGDDSGSEEELVAQIPILGKVAAGVPILSEENFDGIVALPRDFVKRGNYFALTVQGDSMTGAGIMEGDLAVIKVQPTAENGEIVVAMTEDDAVTLKRFFKEKNRIKLQPENPRYNPLYTQNVKVLGKLMHIIRRYD